MKRRNLFVVALIAFLLLVGVTAPAMAAKKVRVGVPLDGAGLGDLSFNDSVHAGVVAAEEDFPIKVRELDQVNPGGKFLSNDKVIKRLSPSSDIVIAVGFLYAEAVAAEAAMRPDVNFVLLDSVVDAPNIASILFAANEGSFLVGAAAALTSQTGKVV